MAFPCFKKRFQKLEPSEKYKYPQRQAIKINQKTIQAAHKQFIQNNFDKPTNEMVQSSKIEVVPQRLNQEEIRNFLEEMMTYTMKAINQMKQGMERMEKKMEASFNQMKQRIEKKIEEKIEKSETSNKKALYQLKKQFKKELPDLKEELQEKIKIATLTSNEVNASNRRKIEEQPPKELKEKKIESFTRVIQGSKNQKIEKSQKELKEMDVENQKAFSQSRKISITLSESGNTLGLRFFFWRLSKYRRKLSFSLSSQHCTSKNQWIQH